MTRLSFKYQITIPKYMRNILHLNPKDQIIYEILEDDRVVIRRASVFDVEYLNVLNE